MTAARGLSLVLVVLCGPSRLEAACTVSATAVNFGTYDVFETTPDTSTGAIAYHCGTKDKNVQIAISKGSSSTFSPRRMNNGAEALTYNLYQDAAFSVIWGDGTNGTGVFTTANPPNNQDVNLPVYGRIPSQQDVSVGNYSDTVIVTISF